MREVRTSAGSVSLLLLQWSPFDHFAITALDPIERSGPFVNWTHGNALDLDTDGNVIVSFRSLNEITKIDAQTGAVIWRRCTLRSRFRGGRRPGAPRLQRGHDSRYSVLIPHLE